MITERGYGPYGATSHIFGSNAKIAYLYWRRYEYTLDREWLRNRAYPMLRGAVEFYRNHPNVKKGADGNYHIQLGRTATRASTAPAIRMKTSRPWRVLPAALLRASAILASDGDLRPVWREFLDHLPPLPTSNDPGRATRGADYHGPRVFVRGLKPGSEAERHDAGCQ